jgi:20S proteasome subunit beta 2
MKIFSPFILKTGTTIVGICCQDGVILGADTRATGGPLVVDKNKLKIHPISPRIFCCAAGTAADCDQITRRTGHQIALMRMERSLSGCSDSLDRVTSALRIVVSHLSSPKSARNPSSSLIMGGIDSTGPSLYQIDTDGVYHRISFAALGSGSVDAISVLEVARREWMHDEGPTSLTKCKEEIRNDNMRPQGEKKYGAFKENVTVDKALESIRRAVQAGILNDMGSGSHIDFCVIKKNRVNRWREKMIAG